MGTSSVVIGPVGDGERVARVVDGLAVRRDDVPEVGADLLAGHDGGMACTDRLDLEPSHVDGLAGLERGERQVAEI